MLREPALEPPEPPLDTVSQVGEGTRIASPVETEEREPLVNIIDPESQASAIEHEAGVSSGASAAALPIIPFEYTGPRDDNVIHLYNTFKKSLDHQAERIVQLGEGKSVSNEETYAQHAAYLALIQEQRFFYYSYQKFSGLRPKNTADTVYHTTGVGGLNVVFELTRGEFPDLFRLQDRVREQALESVRGR
jgi:hypothetical protein